MLERARLSYLWEGPHPWLPTQQQPVYKRPVSHASSGRNTDGRAASKRKERTLANDIFPASFAVLGTAAMIATQERAGNTKCGAETGNRARARPGDTMGRSRGQQAGRMRRLNLWPGPVLGDGSGRKSRKETEQGCPDRRKSAGNHRVGKGMQNQPGSTFCERKGCSRCSEVQAVRVEVM